MKISLKAKVICAVLLMALVLAVAAGIISYELYSQSIKQHYERLTFNTAKSAASMLDVQAIEALAARTVEIYHGFCPDADTPPDFESFSEDDWAQYYAAFEEISASPEYEEAFATLLALKEDNEVLWMYVAFMDEQTGQGIYIIDADSSEDACLPGTCGDIESVNMELIRQGVYDFPPYITNYEEFGWLSSAAAAIRNEDGEVIAHAFVDFSMNEVMSDLRSFMLRLALVLLGVTLVLILLLSFAFNRTVVRPINLLSAATAVFVSEKQQNRENSGISMLDIHTGDEIEHLAKSVRRMEQEINSYIQDLTRVTAERERIGAELDVAKNIQASMLPCIFPPYPRRTEFDIFAAMDPAKEVGGDFYDFFLVDEDHLALVIADVSGKGVPAAMFMVIAKTLLKNSVQSGLGPKAAFELVNNQLVENNDAEMFVTVWLGILTISTGELVCANAGHEFPAVRRAGGKFEFIKDRHGFVMAGMENARYREYTLKLEPGDTLFVYTDGVTDAMNTSDERYGMERTLEALNHSQFTKCQELLQDVREDIDRFSAGAAQFDDITMMAVTVRGPEEEKMRSLKLRPVLEELPAATAFFENTLVEKGAPAKVIAQVNVIVDEIFSNIVHYSGAQSVELGCEAEDGFLRMRFCDDGVPFDPTAKPDTDAAVPLEERKIGGMGIFIVKKTVDGIRYEYVQNRNILTLEKRW